MITEVAWRKAVVDAVRAVADRDYQARAWFGKGPEVDSPDEMYCTLYDDLLFPKFIQSAFLTSEERAAAEELDRLLQRYGDTSPAHLDAAIVFDDPQFAPVREAASVFLSIFTQR